MTRQKPNTLDFAIERNACFLEIDGITLLGLEKIPFIEKFIPVNLDALVCHRILRSRQPY